METYIAELKYRDTTTGTDYYVDTRAIKDANDTSKTLKETLDTKQATLPNASASGKVLKSTDTAGGLEWGDISTQIEVVQTTGTSLTSVMSQNAVTSELATLSSGLNDKANKATTLSGYNITDAKIDSGVITLGNKTITPIVDISGKADKATTLAGYNIADAKISDGTIYLGDKSITPITDVSNKADKSTTTTFGTYKSVTVNKDGIVTAGTNPTTLSGYGITDAKISNGTITLGANSITPLTTVTKAQVGLGNVVNTGDSATPTQGGTDKFTTGGAYTALAGKVDIAQGSQHAGKALVVNSSGNVGVGTISGFVATAQGIANANKRLVTDSGGNVVTQTIYPDWYTDRGDGSDGAFAPTSSTTVAGGVKNYTTVNIPAGVTVTFSSSVIVKCQGAFVNGGTITVTADGGAGGLGGGGSTNGSVGGTGFFGGAGGAGGRDGGLGGAGGQVLARTSILPQLLSGAGGGGGGGYRDDNRYGTGGSGGSGGGYVAVVAQTVINNTINANGTNGNRYSGDQGGGGGGGGGGGIALVANTVTQGTLNVNGGSGGGGRNYNGSAGTAGITFVKELSV